MSQSETDKVCEGIMALGTGCEKCSKCRDYIEWLRNKDKTEKVEEKVLCRGSITLGSACGKCQRCIDEIKKIIGKPPLGGNPMKGWVCPVCGTGVSPFTKQCPCVSMSKPYR